VFNTLAEIYNKKAKQNTVMIERSLYSAIHIFSKMSYDDKI
jgi:hypothetical protein